MQDYSTVILNFFDSCTKYSGKDMTNDESFKRFADILGVVKCDFIIYHDGTPEMPHVIYNTDDSYSSDHHSYHFQNIFAVIEIRTFFKDDSSQIINGANGLTIWDRILYTAVNSYTLSARASYNLMHDQLTGIHNQNYFMRHLGKLIDKGSIDNYVAFYMNIRNCRFLNNVFGNYATDEIIKFFAVKFDGMIDKEQGECLSRLGGDFFTFIALKENLDKYTKLFCSFPIDFVYGTDRIIYDLSFRAGVAELDNTYDIPDKIMAAICSSFILTKNTKKNPPIVFYDENVNNILNKNDRLKSELREDLDAGRLLVYYQPYVQISNNTSNNKITGAEALLRWRREDRMLTPVEFIPVAERNKFITDIDFYVLEKVCQKLSEWKKAGLEIVPVSCNMSEFDLKVHNLHDKILSVIDKYELDHSSICIEFNETAFNNETELTKYIVTQLKESGIRVGLDNCSDAYFSYKTFTDSIFDYIKIDYRSIDTNNNRKLIVLKSIINLAMELNIDVIIEGLADEDIINELSGIGCKTYQGIYFDKPLSERFFENKLKNQ
ncbi:MAG: EAL domain-containing protein [Clostridiales bacterium]|nr:EAL domain-containing protein [Clostridiales bacterium]